MKIEHLLPLILRPELYLSLVVAFTIFFITDTYPVFNHTTDEPAHIAAGLELLDHGTYSYEWQHPPLARLAVALGPYLKGARSERPDERYFGMMYKEGHRIRYKTGSYETTLTLARLSNICRYDPSPRQRGFGDS